MKVASCLNMPTPVSAVRWFYWKVKWHRKDKNVCKQKNKHALELSIPPFKPVSLSASRSFTHFPCLFISCSHCLSHAHSRFLSPTLLLRHQSCQDMPSTLILTRACPGDGLSGCVHAIIHDSHLRTRIYKLHRFMSAMTHLHISITGVMSIQTLRKDHY